MKRVRQLDLFKQIKEIREFDFGVFYFFKEGIIISEMNEGVHFQWDDAKKVVYAAQDIYGLQIPIIYVANRINNYTVVPSDWVKFYKNRNDMAHYAVVGQTKGSFASLVLERLFFPYSIIQFKNLDQAVEWAIEKSKSASELIPQ